MKIDQRVIVFDAGDIQAESSFWAGLLDRTQAPPRGRSSPAAVHQDVADHLRVRVAYEGVPAGPERDFPLHLALAENARSLVDAGPVRWKL